MVAIRKTKKSDLFSALISFLGMFQKESKKEEGHLIVKDNEGEPAAVILKPGEYYLLKAWANIAKDTEHLNLLLKKRDNIEEKEDGLTLKEFLSIKDSLNG